jgi:DNA-binding NarL/FixJ family response regulator
MEKWRNVMTDQKTKRHQQADDKTRILIVDDHPLIRHGLAELINQQTDLDVCGEAEDSAEALRLIKKLKPEMIIVDISLKETSGIELIKDVKIRYPNVAILALSMHDESLYAERALRAGAKGYVMKAEATDNVVTAIRKILAGELYVSDRMSTKMLSNLIGRSKVETSSIERLSDRELEVFRLIGQGYGSRQISERLSLSIKTIETYRAHIKEKLGLADASELLQFAIQWEKSQDRQ